MRVSKKTFAIAAIILLCAAALVAQSSEGAVERYALYVASNKGGQGRETLRYAGSDAQTLADTMVEIGGVKKQNSFILVDSSRDEIDGALDNITSIIERNAKNAKRTEFLFYYSGHSDEDALLLGDESYNYSELKAAITAVPSDVHVVMLDSCFSGNFIRAKGGSREKSFLVDDSAIVQGHAYFSSSSESEASQESDSIGASYFTHSIVTGLRGAADTSGDDKVSLNELYYYAFNDTLSQTETSQIGAQHPSYNITMVGSGDLILTDISVADSVLAIPADASGQFLVRNLEGKLVSEINKVSGNAMSIALPVGMYQVTVISGASTSQTTVQLNRGQTTMLSVAGMRQIQQTTGVARGSGVVQPAATVTGVSRMYGYEGEYNEYNDPYFQGTPVSTYTEPVQTNAPVYISYQPFVFSIFPGINFPAPGNNANIVLSPFMADQDNVEGMQLAGFMNMVSNRMEGIQAAGFMNLNRGNTMGIQAAGFMNEVHGDFEGIQAAGFMNHTKGHVEGIQSAGFLNVAKSVEGVQIGVINVAEKMDGVALGLLNFIGNGIHEGGVYWDFLPGPNNIWIQFQSGTKHFYTTWLAGTRADFDGDYGVFGGGIGWRLGNNGMTLDIELLMRQIITSDLASYIGTNKFHDDWKAAMNKEKVDFGFAEYAYPTARATLNLGERNKFSLFCSYSADLNVTGWNDGAFSVWEPNKLYNKTLFGKECNIRTTWSFGFKF